MNIEIVKEVNLADLVEKVEDTNTIAGVALAFAIISSLIFAFFVYAFVTVSNGQDKDIKKLQEKCDILSKRMDNLVDIVNHHE